MASHDASSDASSHTLTEVATTATNYTTRSAPLFKIVVSRHLITPKVLNWNYEGSGTEHDPFVVEFLPNDARDPMNFSYFKKWAITLLVAFATLAVAFVSSAYSGGVAQIIEEFHSSEEVVVLGISLFVLGVCFYVLTVRGTVLTWFSSLPLDLSFGRHSPSCMADRFSSSLPMALLRPSMPVQLEVRTSKHCSSFAFSLAPSALHLSPMRAASLQTCSQLPSVA